MSASDVETIRLDRSNRAMGLYIEGVAVYEDGTEEVLDSACIGSPREFSRIRAFEESCREQVGI